MRILAAALLLPLFLSWAKAADETVAEAPIVFGTTYTLESSVYGAPREINVYAPDVPSWIEGPLPVVYLVDGGQEQDFFHIAGLSQLTLVNGERVPTIIVGVKTVDRYAEIVPEPLDPRYAEAFPTHGGAETFRRFLLEEVRPLIESRYETGRAALMGESLAGLFVVDTFLRHADSFDDFVAASPSLWWDDRRLTREAASLLEKQEGSDRRLYLTMADEGGTMQLGLDELLATLEAAEIEGLSYRHVDRSAEDSHATIYHHSARDALGWLYGLPPYPQGELPWYLDPEEARAD